MFTKTLNLIALILLSVACGGSHSSGTERSVASVTDSEASVLQDIEEKLTQIHMYKVIGQNQLIIFEKKTNAKPVYLKIQAIKTQIEKIEGKITEIIHELNRDKNDINSAKKVKSIYACIEKFGDKSAVHTYSVEKLKKNYESGSKKQITEITKSDIEKEISVLSSNHQYQVFEQNIEHLSFMLETNKTVDASRSFLEQVRPNKNI